MNLRESFRIPLLFVIICWIVFLFDLTSPVYWTNWGIMPGTLKGFIGIAFAPILHGSFSHIVSNTSTLLVLGGFLYYFYPKLGTEVWLRLYLGTGLLVWLFARQNSVHIGASGLLYGIAAFLFASGLFRRNYTALIVSTIIAFLYVGLLEGLFPNRPGISYESHLFGAVCGVVLAWLYRKRKALDSEEELYYPSAEADKNNQGYQELENDYVKYHYRKRKN